MAEDENTDGPVEETPPGVDGDSPADAGWKPPTKAEWDAYQAKLKKANGEAASHRKQADELRKKGESESDAKVREAVETATKTERDRANRIAVSKGLKAALAEAGYTGSVDVVKRLVELDALEVDDDGEVTGLDEQIRVIKKEFPEKFAKRGARSVDGADQGSAGGSKAGSERRTSEKLLSMWQGV